MKKILFVLALLPIGYIALSFIALPLGYLASPKRANASLNEVVTPINAEAVAKNSANEVILSNKIVASPCEIITSPCEIITSPCEVDAPLKVTSPVNARAVTSSNLVATSPNSASKMNYIARAESENFYAKITAQNTSFYSSPNTSSALFALPYSYFVKVDGVDGEFYEATYNGISGYVLKSEVSLMEGEPLSPYFSAQISVFTDHFLYAQPNSNASVVYELVENDFLTYFGNIVGEKVSDKSDVWYYSSITKNGTTYFGYLYSQIANSLPEISINTELFKEVDEDVFSNSPPEFTSLSPGTKAILIIAIIIPSVFILFFLIKPSALTKAKPPKEKRPRKVQHGDYFEFDDNG